MKKSDELRLKTRKMIAKNLIILVALAVVAFVGAFSWFSNNTSATATGLSATTEAPDSLEYFIRNPELAGNSISTDYDAINTWISDHSKSWHSGEWEFDFDDPELQFMKDLFLCDITGDGKDFYAPVMTQSGYYAVVDMTAKMEQTVRNQDYMSFDIYFRSKTQGDVVLKYDSTIEPNNSEDASYKSRIASQQVVTLTSNNENDYKAAAIGAVRMSVYNGNTRELLWIPGPCVWLDGIYNENNDTYSLYTGLRANASASPINYTFNNKSSVYMNGSTPTLRTGESTRDHSYYTSNDGYPSRQTISYGNDSSLVASSNGDYQLGQTSQNDIVVCSLDTTKIDNGTTYYINRIRVNLWIEGEDAEARLKFINGIFRFNLKFDIVSST